MFDFSGWSNFLQNPQDLSKIAPVDRSMVPTIKPNMSMSAPQIQGGINAPMQNFQATQPSMDPAKMMSLMGRFGMPQMGQQQQPQMQLPPAQMPQSQAPTGTFSGLSPFMPRPPVQPTGATGAAGEQLSPQEYLRKYGGMFGATSDGSNLG